MASSYAIPSPPVPLPHAHRNHLYPTSPPSHSHNHSQSHSSPSSSPISIRNPRSPNGSVHSHSQSLTHARTNGHGPSLLKTQQAEPSPRQRNPPAPLNIAGGWKEESTPGGRKVLTPTTATFSSPYSPPDMNGTAGHDHRSSLNSGKVANWHSHENDDGHGHGHSHGHDHSHGHRHGHSTNGSVHIHSLIDHAHQNHAGHEHGAKKSILTRFLLQYTTPYPFLHTIMTEKDSRRILYYLTLNVSFMLVQAFYGYVTDSLGLLSDTVHMFFDCVALLVGLMAAVISKWPPSQRFPYGLGKMETLSGFANGILLVLLSLEITFEAFERLYEGSKPTRLGELFTVSLLGMLVNLVGVFAFGHHHHGHSHGHSHDHSHGHDGDGHAHGHSHDNENMQGIYLHVLADTLGSLSVVVSTALMSVWGWAGWDPLASVFISILILLSSKPLIVSSARRLLLSIPNDTEYNLRNVLAGISQQRGVVGCAAPKFWVDDRGGGHTGDKLLGIVHVVAARGASMDEVRDGVSDFLLKNGMDITVQVEREGDGGCWCAAGRPTFTPVTPMTPMGPKQL